MSLFVFSVVLIAAALHAGWNALVKGHGDTTSNMAAVVIGHAPLAVISIVASPTPAPESWPYLVAGAVLHLGYQIFLLFSYRLGELTHVYPIARGSAPILVALTSVMFLGVHLSGLEIGAVLLIGTGIISMAFVRGADGLRNPRAAVGAVITGLFIAGYSIVDGMGARLAGTSFGFYGWLSLINAAVFAVIFAVRSPHILRQLPHRAPLALYAGGSASFAAYALVTWAFTQAPIALVTALRETSIVFALLIGVFFLKEKLNLLKVLSTMMTISGAILLRLGKGP
ncbi:MAG: EamA family transporter [Beijerinckiaceae bacterium]